MLFPGDYELADAQQRHCSNCAMWRPVAVSRVDEYNGHRGHSSWYSNPYHCLGRHAIAAVAACIRRIKIVEVENAHLAPWACILGLAVATAIAARIMPTGTRAPAQSITHALVKLRRAFRVTPEVALQFKIVHRCVHPRAINPCSAQSRCERARAHVHVNYTGLLLPLGVRNHDTASATNARTRPQLTVPDVLASSVATAASKET